MTITPGQMKLLQTGRRKLDLDEDVWRAVLVKCAGVASAQELTCDDFDSVLALLRHLGFDPVTPNGAGSWQPARLCLARSGRADP